jgi:hypothetical protein
MKKIIRLLATVSFFTACNKNDNDKGNLHLTGEIKGLKQGKLYIQKLNDTNLVVIDSILFDGDSKFESHLNIESPEMLYLFLDKGNTKSIDNSLFIFAEPGKMNLETSLELFYSDAKVTGSKNHDLYMEYRKINEPFRQKNLEFIEQELKAGKLQQQSVYDSIQKEKEMAVKRRYLRVVNFAKNHKDYEISPYVLLYDINDVNLTYMDSIQKMYPEKIKQSKYGKELKKWSDQRHQTEK